MDKTNKFSSMGFFFCEEKHSIFSLDRLCFSFVKRSLLPKQMKLTKPMSLKTWRYITLCIILSYIISLKLSWIHNYAFFVSAFFLPFYLIHHIGEVLLYVRDLLAKCFGVPLPLPIEKSVFSHFSIFKISCLEGQK